MTMGPEPMSRILRRSVRFGMVAGRCSEALPKKKVSGTFRRSKLQHLLGLESSRHLFLGKALVWQEETRRPFFILQDAGRSPRVTAVRPTRQREAFTTEATHCMT